MDVAASGGSRRCGMASAQLRPFPRRPARSRRTGPCTSCCHVLGPGEGDAGTGARVPGRSPRGTGHRFLPQHGGSEDSRLWPPCRGPFQRQRGWFSPEHRRPRLWPGGCGLVGRDEVGPIVPTGLTATVFARTLPEAAKGNGAIRTSALVPGPRR